MKMVDTSYIFIKKLIIQWRGNPLLSDLCDS